MKNIIQTIKQNKRFLISAHVNPDPDALCSELALALFLRSKGKLVTIVNQDTVPKRFHFIPGVSRILSYQAKRKVNYDVAIIVDCGDLNRIGKVAELLQKDKKIINIDHHITNDRFGDLNLIEPKASSTAEVLYELFLKAKGRMTKTMAMHLYMGIMTDTGSFRYENTSSRTHAIAAELVKFKFSVPAIHRQLYEAISTNDLKEFTKVIKGFDMRFNKKVVSVDLTKKTLSKFSNNFDLRDTIFKFLRVMKGVEVFVILTEVDRNKTRINLRSSSVFDVSKLAGQFDGGGHKRASGCSINKNISSSKAEILKVIGKAL